MPDGSAWLSTRKLLPRVQNSINQGGGGGAKADSVGRVYTGLGDCSELRVDITRTPGAAMVPGTSFLMLNLEADVRSATRES
jgi:hypothetical protein